MGYYTRHNLSVIDGDQNLIKEFREFSEYAKYAIDDFGRCEESSKWYSHQTELKEFSVLHPNVLFKLDGEGEENGDMWHEYYKNGKLQICKASIVYDDFDPALLK